ncbi:MAG: LamG-like jellyroll fold domain-containing protein, partial [Thiogranum sp.]
MTTTSFDALNRPLAVQYPGGETITISYDREGENSLTAGGDQIVGNVTYNGRGQVKAFSRPNGPDITYGYHPQSGNFRLQSLRHASSGSDKPEFRYEYDAVGNITEIETWRSNAIKDTQTFGYDHLNRLVDAQAAGVAPYHFGYAYDKLGNVDKVTDILNGNSVRDYAYGNQPHAVTTVTEGSNVETFSYDTNGNMTVRQEAGSEYAQIYDSENRLIHVADVNAATFTDDFNSKDTAAWIYNSQQSVPYNLGGENVVQSVGTNTNWNGNFYRNDYSLASDESVQLEFQVTSTNPTAHFAVESAGTWGQTQYNRLSLLVRNNGFEVQEYVGLANPQIIYTALPTQLQSNTWYVLTIVADDLNGFSLQVYEKENPANSGIYRTNAFPKGESWRFRHWIYRDTAYLDNYSEQPVTSFAYDAGGIRVKTVKPDGTVTYTPFPNYEETISGAGPGFDKGGAWHFDEGSGSTTADSSIYRRDGQLQGPQWVDGFFGQALDFDGANDYVKFTEEPDITGELTVSAWVRPEQAPTGLGRLAAGTYAYNGGGSNDRGWFLGKTYGDEDEFHFHVIDENGSAAYAKMNGFFATYLNQWVHVTGVFRPGEAVELYINGQMAAQDTTNIPGEIGQSGVFKIGARPDNTTQGHWDGQIDEVQILADALSAEEVETLAEVASWSLDEGAGEIVHSEPGNRFRGELKGAQWTTGYHNQALDFDGVNDYVRFNETIELDGELTVSAWVRPEQAPTGVGRMIVSTYKWGGGSANRRGWYLGDVWGSDDQLNFNVCDQSGATAGVGLPGFWATYQNQWVHVAGVYKPGQVVQLYVNGQLVGEDTTNVPDAIGQSGLFKVGARSDNTTQGHWDGQIDDMQIVGRALSVAEIQALSNETAATITRRSTYSLAGVAQAVRVT